MVRVVLTLLLCFPITGEVLREEADPWNLEVQIEGGVPNQLQYAALRRAIVELTNPCPKESVVHGGKVVVEGARGWDWALVEALEGVQRPLAEALLEHLVDDEYIPVLREPRRDDYASRTVMVDPFAFGAQRFRLDGLPNGYTIEMRLTSSEELSLRVTRPGNFGSEVALSIEIWGWLGQVGPDDRGKFCGFSRHY